MRSLKLLISFREDYLGPVFIVDITGSFGKAKIANMKIANFLVKSGHQVHWDRRRNWKTKYDLIIQPRNVRTKKFQCQHKVLAIFFSFASYHLFFSSIKFSFYLLNCTVKTVATFEIEANKWYVKQVSINNWLDVFQ